VCVCTYTVYVPIYTPDWIWVGRSGFESLQEPGLAVGPIMSLATRILESVSLGGNSREIKMAIHFVELGQRMRGALRAWVVCVCFTCVLRNIMNSRLP
jgi:hypothetical protein